VKTREKARQKSPIYIKLLWIKWPPWRCKCPILHPLWLRYSLIVAVYSRQLNMATKYISNLNAAKRKSIASLKIRNKRQLEHKIECKHTVPSQIYNKIYSWKKIKNYKLILICCFSNAYFTFFLIQSFLCDVSYRFLIF